jgi:hypothetical protein
MNLYEYAGGDPVNGTDPSGLCFVLSCNAWHSVSNTVAGWGDAVTGGATREIRGALGLAQPDFSSSEYQSGAVAGIATAVLIPGDEEAGALSAAEHVGQESDRLVGFAPGRWLSHFEDHGGEFGYKNSVEYLKGANDLIRRDGVEAFTRPNGDQLFYDRGTNEFAVQGSNGYLRTYFKPEQGSAYWDGQTGG